MPPIIRGVEAQGRFIKVNAVAELGAGGAYQSFNFYSDNFQPGEGLVDDDEIGGDRHNLVDPTQQVKDLPNPSGQLTVALDRRQIGYWLTSMWGAPNTTGVGPYTHVWRSGGTEPGLIGFELPLANEIFRIADAAAISQMTLNLADQGGVRQVQMDAVLRSVRRLNAALSASVTAAPERDKVGGGEGVLKINDVALGSVLGGQMTLSNGASGERYLDDSAYISAIEIGKPSFTLAPQIRVRQGAGALLDQFDGVTPFSAELVFAKGANSLAFKATNVVAAPVLPSPQNISGMEVTPTFMASQTSSAPMVEITLVNDVESY